MGYITDLHKGNDTILIKQTNFNTSENLLHYLQWNNNPGFQWDIVGFF